MKNTNRMDQWLNGLREKNWDKMNPAQRLAMLQELENIMAARQGRPALRVNVIPSEETEKRPGVMGYFNEEGIYLNARYFVKNKSSVLKLDRYNVGAAINTVIHEGRHAWQSHVIESAAAGADDNLKAAILLNKLGYRKGGSEYSAQLIELDARRYARREYGAMLRRMQEMGWTPDAVLVREQRADHREEEIAAAYIKSELTEADLDYFDAFIKKEFLPYVMLVFPDADFSFLSIFDEAKRLVRGEITVKEFVEGEPVGLSFREAADRLSVKEEADDLSFEDSFWAALEKPAPAKPKADKTDDFSVRPIGKGSGF